MPFPSQIKPWSDYSDKFQKLELAPKATLLREGEIPTKIFVVQKGCVRAWFNHDGKDVTCQFFFENSSVASIESLMKELPSPISLETIEPCTIWFLEKSDWKQLLDDMAANPETRQKFIEVVFSRTFEYIKHSVSFIRDTPATRYANLLAEKPQVARRVPQHYIASYLGISTVHLSRIKSRFLKPKGGI